MIAAPSPSHKQNLKKKFVKLNKKRRKMMVMKGTAIGRGTMMMSQKKMMKK
jgi:hypothetical protein